MSTKSREEKKASNRLRRRKRKKETRKEIALRPMEKRKVNRVGEYIKKWKEKRESKEEKGKKTQRFTANIEYNKRYETGEKQKAEPGDTVKCLKKQELSSSTKQVLQSV